MHCSDCGSENIQAAPRDARHRLVLRHEVDLRHIPPVASDEELEAFRREAHAAHAQAIDRVIEAHKRARAEREEK